MYQESGKSYSSEVNVAYLPSEGKRLLSHQVGFLLEILEQRIIEKIIVTL